MVGNTSAAWRSRLGSVGLTLVLLTALTLTLPAAGSRAVAATTPVTVVNALGDGRPVVRLDTDGNPLDAHDGQLLVDTGRYWLIGMAYSCGQEWPGRRTPGVVSTTCGVRAYSSPDLVTRTNEGFLVDGSAMPSSPKLACTPACWRPKALHTRSGWVIWINSPARSTRNRLAPRQTLRVPLRGGHLLSVTAALCIKATTAADVVVDDVATFP